MAARALIAGVSVVALAAAAAAGCAPAPPPLPVIGAIPEFSLTSADGRPFARADLQGAVWIVDFVFTRCSGPCPMMTTKMRGLQKSLEEAEAAGRVPAGRIRLLTITVDPDYDTPEILAAYAKEHNADPARWKFLTGAERDIFDLSQKGFLLAAGRDEAAAAQFGGPVLTHSEKFTLVDTKGRVRAYYDSSDFEALRRLVADAVALAGEPGS